MDRTRHFIIQAVIAFHACTRSAAQDDQRREEIQNKFDDYRFEDFIKKFDPRTVVARIERMKSTLGTNFTAVKYLDLMHDGIDQTEDLLKLRVQDIRPPPAGTKTQHVDQMIKDARRWRPLPGLNYKNQNDVFDLRIRFYELMRQAIYQARNEMVIMQQMREKYRKYSLYKMGFLISKTDNAVATFSKFAFRIFKQCGMTRAEASPRMFLYHNLLKEERLLHLWFNAQLLTEIIIDNYKRYKELLDLEACFEVVKLSENIDYPTDINDLFPIVSNTSSKLLNTKFDFDIRKINIKKLAEKITSFNESIVNTSQNDTRRQVLTWRPNMPDNEWWWKRASEHMMRQKTADLMLQQLYMGRHIIKRLEEHPNFKKDDEWFRMGYLTTKLNKIYDKALIIMSIMSHNRFGRWGAPKWHLMLHHRGAARHNDFNYIYWVLVKMDARIRKKENTPLKLPTDLLQTGGFSDDSSLEKG